ncbi:MAG: flagellar biosynthesis protein FlhB [Alphaproteobacteria bacterium]|nr:flagellar biosynthesis protein FlhB [Alphaproteobacteria bacterium]
MVAEDDDESSKTEEASERKLSKAKEEGDVAISQEAKNFIILLGVLFVVWLILPMLLKWFYKFNVKFIEAPESITINIKTMQLLLKSVIIDFFKIMAIPFAIFIVLGIFASVMQTGFIFAPKKLELKWDKLNFIKELPNLINMRKIVESVKGILKIIVVAFIGIYVIKPYLNKAELLPTMDTIAILSFIHKVVVMLIFTMVIAVFVIAIADFLYQKFSHLKKMRMTKQEVKEEYKQSEGDPLVKSKIRQIRHERARQRMMDNVPKADVIIVNPTHYAVALEYKMDTMEAPKVVAKGVDHLALRIREMGEANDVPIVENPPLARALFASVELDDYIPSEHFKAVAEVIGYVMQLKQ